MNQVTMWATTVIAIGGALAVIWGLTRPIAKKAKGLVNSLDKFVRDWEGEDASPGRQAVPGVMERLNNIDGELKHNGGTTMKDAVKRIEDKLQKIDNRLASGDKRMSEIEGRLK
jgi:hypothetical protein